MPLISAHRCGAEGDPARENTREALVHATGLDVDYVEFDVQRCGDGVFVLFHDDHATIDGRQYRVAELAAADLAASEHPFLRYDEALRLLAEGGKRAHIDLKFVSPDGLYADPATTYEAEAAAMAIDVMGASRVVITSLEDRSVRAIRRWAEPGCPELLVGLSLGRDTTGRRLGERLHTRWIELFPRIRIRDSEANVVVANKRLAGLTLARFAARRGLPLLVWTVDDPAELERWLADPRTWMVTTNVPQVAAGLRETARHRARRRLRS